MNRREQLAFLAGMLNMGTDVDKVLQKAEDFGFYNRQHEGMDERFFDEDPDNLVAEWLAGQLISTLKTKNHPHTQFFVLQTSINLIMEFLEFRYGYESRKIN